MDFNKILSSVVDIFHQHQSENKRTPDYRNQSKSNNQSENKKTSNQNNNQSKSNNPFQKEDESQRKNNHLPPEISPEIIELAKKLKEKKIPKINNIVFAGGGVKGFAYIGVYQALKRLDILDLKEISAVSVGSIFSLALVLDYQPEELYSFITTFEYDMVKSFDFLHALDNWGIENGNKFMLFIQALFRHKTQVNDLTFQELYDRCHIKFTVAATNLTANQLIYFNHINTPNHSVLFAVRKSFALPLMITPIKDGDDLFVDGGVLNNFPIDQLPNSEHTMGFCFNDGSHKRCQIEHLESYLYNLIFSVVNYNSCLQIQNSINTKAHVVHINPHNQSAYGFFVDYEIRKTLWQAGYQATIDYFNNMLENLGDIENHENQNQKNINLQQNSNENLVIDENDNIQDNKDDDL